MICKLQAHLTRIYFSSQYPNDDLIEQKVDSVILVSFLLILPVGVYINIFTSINSNVDLYKGLSFIVTTLFLSYIFINLFIEYLNKKPQTDSPDKLYFIFLIFLISAYSFFQANKFIDIIMLFYIPFFFALILKKYTTNCKLYSLEMFSIIVVIANATVYMFFKYEPFSTFSYSHLFFISFFSLYIYMLYIYFFLKQSLYNLQTIGTASQHDRGNYNGPNDDY
jgi:hypothetical protein